MTPQTIFDTVVQHLHDMPRQAAAYGQCRYRTPEGSRCAVGVLITDEEYKPEMDLLLGGGTVCRIADNGLLPQRLVPHLKLLAAVQAVHDDPNNWDDRTNMGDDLLVVASRHQLDDALVRRLFP